MLKFQMKLTGAQTAAMRASATPQALKNLYFNQVSKETQLLWETTRRNAYDLPKAPTGRLRDSIRMGFEERGNQLVGRVLADLRIAPYAEFVEFGHFMPNRTTWIPGIHFMELAFLEVRKDSRRRIERGLFEGLRWYDSPGAVHRRTGEQLAIV